MRGRGSPIRWKGKRTSARSGSTQQFYPQFYLAYGHGSGGRGGRFLEGVDTGFSLGPDIVRPPGFGRTDENLLLAGLVKFLTVRDLTFEIFSYPPSRPRNNF